MKRFLGKVAIYCSSILLVGYGIIYFAILVCPEKALGYSAEYNIWKYKKSAITHRYGQSKNLVIGDSRGMAALNPAILEHNFINLCITGATPFEGYVTLKEFLENNNADTIVLCYSTFHFVKGEVFNERTLPFRLPNKNDIDNLAAAEKHNGITIDGEVPTAKMNFERLLLYYHVPMMFREQFLENITQQAQPNVNQHIEKNLRDNNGHSLLGTLDSSNGRSQELEVIASHGGNATLNNVIKNYVDSIFQLAEARKIKLIIAPPPFNQTSYDLLKNTGLYSAYQEMLKGLQAKYPSLTIYHKYHFLPNNYFGDPSHLNHKGSVFFSNYIRTEISNEKANSQGAINL